MRAPITETQVGAVIGVLKKTPARLAAAGLPDDLLDQAIKRLTWMAGIVGVLFALGLATNIVLHFSGTGPLPFTSTMVRIVAILDAAALYWVLRSRRFSRQLKVDLGLVFEVLGAFSISFVEHSMLAKMHFPIGPVPTVCVWILLFRLIVPATPVKALLAAIGSAATVPLAAWIADSVGFPRIDPLLYGARPQAVLMTAIVAWIASKSIYSMGEAVSAAREMGSYRLEKLLGRGGMGEVWCASHRMLKREAAIKLIRPEALGVADSHSRERALKRFEREAQATAKLRSPHTVQLFDFGTTADGSFYYVMELLDGLDLETLVEKHGPLPAERAVYLLEQACHSLADAHGQNFIHRDIKPANIFVCRLGGDHDFVKVLDFGLVKETEESDSEVKLSADGIATGTPAYMAPEIALGKNASPKTDLYMLGCVGYWLLTGSLVFEGDTPLAVVSKHVGEEPVPPSQRGELEVPPEMENVILACLRKDPAERPASAVDLMERFRDIRLDERWTEQRARAWWDRHKPG